MTAYQKVDDGLSSANSSIELGPAAPLQMIGVEGKTHVAQACSDLDDHIMR